MKTEKISLPLDHFPQEIRTDIERANIYDSSSHSGATVLYLDTGYYLKMDQKGKLAQEVTLAKWFEEQGLGVPVLSYFSTDQDYLLTREASDKSALAFLGQAEALCQTMAASLKKLHVLRPRHFPVSNRIEDYKQEAKDNYQKGCFYEKALLPQFQIQNREEAYQLIQDQGHLLTADALIHGDACLPNFILKDAATFSCFIDLGLAGFSDRHIDLYWAIWSLTYNLSDPQYAELFLDYYGRKDVDADKLRLIAAFEAFG
ncbi:aminoglycoside 3'-phosphotransferase [Streptococcus panodentis]|uniref:Aminoglycoside phosphotransferase APH(3') n=1 Tax=Streptococcus panodentis TaxID=1581472 RepID=A0ABS5AZ59_9STRE|nr:aminoglycoside 3'-phosphotransferase [Streptococcus panodentis]MBP2621551.1 aminoglycoside phosphotransferase APH(3') [Streptococcus panodentis]